MFLYLGEETAANDKAIHKAAQFFDKAIQKAAQFFDKAAYWNGFCRETLLSFVAASEEYKTIAQYFDFYKEEAPDVFGADNASSLSLADMVNCLIFKSMASHGSGGEQHFVVDFTLDYDQLLCVKFDSESKPVGISWES